jgi:hypothetical protein
MLKNGSGQHHKVLFTLPIRIAYQKKSFAKTSLISVVFFLSYFLPFAKPNFTINKYKMAGQLDLFMLEKQAGTQFANRIKRNLVSSIRSKTNKGSGLALKSTVKPFYKNNLLERITIFTPYYIYPILHVGFEGTKANGINVRLKARDFIIDAVERGKAVEELADIIGNQRAEVIINRINFGFDRNTQSSNTLGNE